MTSKQQKLQQQQQSRAISMIDTNSNGVAQSFSPRVANNRQQVLGAQGQSNRMSYQNVTSQSMVAGGPGASRKSLNSNRLLDQPSLPQTFDLRNVRELDSDNCMLCEAPFTNKLKVMNRNTQKNCKRCGRAICDSCSDQRRQLAKDDAAVYRVCDKCDTEMDNFRLKRNHEDVLAAQKKKIEMLNNQLVQLEEDKQKLQDDCEAEMRELQTKVKAKYAKRDELNDRLNQLKSEIQHQNNARNFLHKSICDLENVIADLEVEQKRLMTKQSTVQTQTIELEHQLRQRTIQNQEQLQRLEALKQKVSK